MFYSVNPLTLQNKKRERHPDYVDLSSRRPRVCTAYGVVVRAAKKNPNQLQKLNASYRIKAQ